MRSGTAGVLELARFARSDEGKTPARNSFRVGSQGEELGLLGSAEWVKEPTLRSIKPSPC